MGNRKVCVLIVEDEALIARCLSMDLKDEGYSVCGLVASGEEAVEKAKRDNPDIVFMDIHLAGEIDGIEAAKAIVKDKKIPILFMTAFSGDDLKNRAKAVHPVGYLNKPVDIEDIKSVIEPLFKGYKK